MNNVNIIGRFTKDMKLEYSQGGTAYLRNSIAVDRRGKDDVTDFFNVTAFGKSAEFIDKYFSKGSKVAISGHLQSDTTKDGEKRTSVSIIIDSVDFCEKKGEKTEENPGDDFLNVTVTEELPFE